jgi:hypothetical protein
MLSEPNAINFLLSGALGAVISSIFLIINNQWTSSVNNKFQLEREEKQRIWQLEREEKQRIWQEKSELQKWYREKIYSSYEASLQILIKIQQEQLEYLHKNRVETVEEYLNKPKHLNNINKLILEFNIRLSIIINDYPDKNSKEFTEKIDKIDKSLGVVEESWNVRHIILELMKNDSRIKSTNY